MLKTILNRNPFLVDLNSLGDGKCDGGVAVSALIDIIMFTINARGDNKLHVSVTYKARYFGSKNLYKSRELIVGIRLLIHNPTINKRPIWFYVLGAVVQLRF